MEAVLQSGDIHPLIGELSLQQNPSLSWVQRRNWASVHCATPTANPGGVNVVVLNLSSATQWADPLSHTITFKVQNTGSTDLEFISSNPTMLFERLEVRLGNTIVEDIQGFNRLSEIFTIYQSTGKRYQTAQMGFGVRDKLTATGSTAPLDVGPQLMHSVNFKPEKIAAGASKRVLMKLNVSGLMSQNKWIPLWALNGGAELRLTLANPEEVVKLNTEASTPAPTQSKSYNLSEIAMQVAMCTLDSELQEKYFQQLAGGAPLLMHLQGWSHQQVFLAAASTGDCNVSFSKPLSRLGSIFVTMAPALGQTEIHAGIQYANTFAAYRQNRENFECYIQLGSERVPDAPIQGYVQAYDRLLQAMGIHSSNAQDIGVDMDSYSSLHFMIGLDLEKVPGLLTTGHNIGAGQEIRVNIKNFADSGNKPERCYIALHYDVFYEIRAGSVTLLT